MSITRVRYQILALALLFLAACSGYEKILKSDDPSYKLTKANEFYEKEQYQKARMLYESLLPILKGTKNFEPLYLKYAYSSYYLEDYLSASYHFRNFLDYFPGSSAAEEAEYMHAVSLYRMSPKVSLDQTNTIKAMEALQSFINTHPESKRVAEANKLMDEMRSKMEKKTASAADLYFKIGQFKAASIAFQSVMEQYPESDRADYYQYMVARALYHYAEQSIETKQQERYVSALSAIGKLEADYPKSPFIPQTKSIITQINEKINNFQNEHE